MNIIYDTLLSALKKTGAYHADYQDPPACILWPDADRQWESIVPRLLADLPELFILGEFNPEKRTGPAIWLRCVLARTLDDVKAPFDTIPILYLPGVGKLDLRAVESCPTHLIPLAELQYRGVVWSQSNGKDWTIFAFLKSEHGGLGLDVAQDNDTKHAILLSLGYLLDEEINLLIGKRLDKDYFNTLLTGGDPTKNLLLWLDQGEDFKTSLGGPEWEAFVQVCVSQLGFSPDKNGLIEGADKLARHEGPWLTVWSRYCEAPLRYPSIPDQIRKAKPPTGILDWHTGGNAVEGWPQWNEEQEQLLRKDLELLQDVPSHQARKKIPELEKKHANRRNLIWAQLGQSQLAFALEHLSQLAEITSVSLAVGTIDEMKEVYLANGWKADDAVCKALASVRKPEDQSVISSVIQTIYLPWAEDSARYLQKIVQESEYPGGFFDAAPQISYQDGDCILFVDGLRCDTAHRIEEYLNQHNKKIALRPFWVPLPSVTQTGKPAITPVKDQIIGLDRCSDFEPVKRENESVVSGSPLKRLIEKAGFEILDSTSNGSGSGKGWCEYGDIDKEGHTLGWKLAHHLEFIIEDISNRVLQLLDSGWKRVHIVTDHGWLLMPGGLPKINIPQVLSEVKWKRVASVKEGVTVDERLYPWFWNPSVKYAIADGISCFRGTDSYTHGGLSLQECLTLQICVTSNQGSSGVRSGVKIEHIWKKLRCFVTAEGDISDLLLDVRTKAGDPATSLVESVKPLNESGTASVVIKEADNIGQKAFVVLLKGNNELIAQEETIIGGLL